MSENYLIDINNKMKIGGLIYVQNVSFKEQRYRRYKAVWRKPFCHKPTIVATLFFRRTYSMSRKIGNFVTWKSSRRIL